MKTNLKKMLGLTALGMTLLTNTVPTWAGLAGYLEVQISGTGDAFAARGYMNSVRYSKDSQQYIGCGASTFADGSRFASCGARTRGGAAVYCSTFNPSLVEKIQKMTDSSSVLFGGSRTTGACSDIAIGNGSPYLK